MRIFIIIWLTLSSFLTGCTQSSLKLVTYNIRLDHAGDNQDNWHNRKEDFISFIKKEKPDFLGIQEALIHQAEYIDGALSDYNYIGVGRDDGKQRGEIMAIFYLKNKWKLIEDSTIWLSETPLIPSKGWDADFYRTCTYGLFTNQTNESIAVFNTHFDHQAAMARINSAELIKDFVHDIANDDHYILMGDFNATPDTKIYASLTDYFLDTYHHSKSKKEAFEGSFNGFQLNGEFKRRIDYIFTSDAFTIHSYEMPAPLTKNKRHISDHFPIIVTIEKTKK